MPRGGGLEGSLYREVPCLAGGPWTVRSHVQGVGDWARGALYGEVYYIVDNGHMEPPLPLPTGQNDKSENNNFPQLRWWTVINNAYYIIINHGTIYWLLCQRRIYKGSSGHRPHIFFFWISEQPYEGKENLVRECAPLESTSDCVRSTKNIEDHSSLLECLPSGSQHLLLTTLLTCFLSLNSFSPLLDTLSASPSISFWHFFTCETEWFPKFNSKSKVRCVPSWRDSPLS